MTPKRAQCPDCSAVAIDRHMGHDDTCPLGLAIDATMEEDRDWFAAHPFAAMRHRKMKPVERSEFCMFMRWEVLHRDDLHVQVISLPGGSRLRRPYGGPFGVPYSAEQVDHVRRGDQL